MLLGIFGWVEEFIGSEFMVETTGFGVVRFRILTCDGVDSRGC